MARFDTRLGDCKQYFRNCKVGRYLNARKDAIAAFVRQFTNVELIDEMVSCINDYFSEAANELYEDEMWRNCSFAEVRLLSMLSCCLYPIVAVLSRFRRPAERWPSTGIRPSNWRIARRPCGVG